MSIFGLMDESTMDAGDGAIEAPATEFVDVFSAAVPGTARNHLFNSKEWFTDTERNSRDKKYKQLTGRDLKEDVINSLKGESYGEKFTNWPADVEKQQALIDSYITANKGTDPNKYKEIYTTAELGPIVQAKARAAAEKQAKASAGATGFASFTGNLAGGVAASLIDPVNLATLPLGAARSASILKTALVEAGANVGAEVISHGNISSWQAELGNEYGIKDLALNATVGAVFGASIGGGMKAITKSLALDRMADHFDEIGNVEASLAAKTESRRLHIEETNPARYSDELDATIHQKAVEEVDAALAEGRALNHERLGVTDEQIRGLDQAKMDDGTKAVHQRLIDDTSPERVAENPKLRQEQPSELLDFRRPEAPNVTRQKELAQMQESPEWKAREQADFNERFKEGDERLFNDEEVGDLSIDEIRRGFKDEEDYLNAISSCGLGAG